MIQLPRARRACLVHILDPQPAVSLFSCTISMPSFDDFRYGLRSMAPVGTWLPWQEVLRLAAPFGWTPQACADTAMCLQSLRVAELNPPPVTWTESSCTTHTCT